MLNLQPAVQIDYAHTSTGEWLAQCCACPAPEIANAFNRAGIKFRIVSGLLGLEKAPEIAIADEATAERPEALRAWKEIGEWTRAAVVKANLAKARFGFLGNNYSGMLDMYSDFTMAQAQTGIHVELLEMCDLNARLEKVTDEEVKAKLAEIEAMFEISGDSPADPLARRPTDEQLEWSAKVACAQERMVKDFNLDALVYYYHGADGNAYEQLQSGFIVGHSLLTAQGVPCSGEGDLKTAIENAEALIAEGVMTNGVAAFQEAINTAKGQLAQAATDFANDAEAGASFVDVALEDLKMAENTFRVANACYAYPANVITNGGMNSMDGWDVLNGGTDNPALHINTSGNVTNFSKPFMECWVKDANYGEANYARQTVNKLPSGLELPKGYYVLKAAALATRQDQPDLKVSGVTLRLQDQEMVVQTANGVANIYMIGFDKPTAGGELTFGLYIDENTDANWIAWDEVELQFVGDKDKYLADYSKAVLGESLEALQVALEAAKKAIENVDMTGVDFEESDLYLAMQEAEYVLEDPVASQFDKTDVDLLIQQIYDAINDFYVSGVSPKEGSSFDFTSMIKNADFDVEAGTEWTVETENGVLPGGTDCVNWWFGSSGPDETTQEFSQTVAGLPAGNYLLDVKAAVRVDMTYSTANYTAENLPNYMTLCKVYANNDSADVHPFFYEDEALGLTLEGMMAMTNDWDYRHGNGTLIDDMLKGSDYFHSYIPFTLEEKGSVKVGFRIELPNKSGQMPFIDYFHLAYFGKYEQIIPGATPTGIANFAKNVEKVPAGIYNMKGQLVRNGNSLNGLAKGLYIIGGKKVVIR